MFCCNQYEQLLQIVTLYGMVKMESKFNLLIIMSQNIKKYANSFTCVSSRLHNYKF